MRLELDWSPASTSQATVTTGWFKRWSSRLVLLASGLMLAGLVGVALFPGLFAPHDPNQVRLELKLSSPSATYPLGTDQFGRCNLSRLVFGARATLGASSVILGVTTLVSLSIAAATLFGPAFLRVFFLRLLDLGLALPTLVVAIAVVSILGPGLFNAIVALAVTMWAAPARLVRGLLLDEIQAQHIFAARAIGVPPLRLFFQHILTGLTGRLAVVFSLYFGQIILALSALSFLGLGPQPPSPEWGAMFNEGRSQFFISPFLMILPGVAIVMVVGACNLLAEALAQI
ncbi:MAG: ABC transporter permease [Anaerolineae bacterium]|nr:ABC transporter permease subunit [Anaerolineales bacterium]MCQ3972346.1 nickel ABC transporter permease subunit NikC [Anaerolineae bacterium]